MVPTSGERHARDDSNLVTRNAQRLASVLGLFGSQSVDNEKRTHKDKKHGMSHPDANHSMALLRLPQPTSRFLMPFQETLVSNILVSMTTTIIKAAEQ